MAFDNESMIMAPWQDKAAAKRASILASIPEEWRLSQSDLARAQEQRDLTGPFIRQFLNDEEVAITALDSVPLVGAIKSRKFSAVQVARAFCKTAAVAHQINNCLHELFVDQALARAKELDEYQEAHGRTVGLLHGLPVSLKDQFHVKGVDTSMGYVGWIGSNMGISHPEEAHRVESQITKELLSVGAVLFCKTSVPQTLMMGETINHIIGRTLNPHNQNLSCGGSSGGEAALQALRGSTLGVGTDIGGSVRIPGGFCGIFSLKPTPERISYKDCGNTTPGQTICRSAVGFLSTSVDGLNLALKAVLSTQPWLNDPAVVPIPYRQDMSESFLARGTRDANSASKPLKIGVLWRNNMVEPHPPVRRALKLLASAVKNAGHRIVDWKPPPAEPAFNVHRSLILSDGNHDIHKQLARSGEPLVPELEKTLRLRDPLPLLEVHDLTLQGQAYEIEYSDYWNSTAKDDGQIVDAIITPVAPHAAVIPGKFFHMEYTRTFNLLNYAAAVIPVTKADKAVDVVDDSYQPISGLDRKNWEAYDPEIYYGAPVGLQIVARKFEEEKVLAIAKVLHTALLAEKTRYAAAL